MAVQKQSPQNKLLSVILVNSCCAYAHTRILLFQVNYELNSLPNVFTHIQKMPLQSYEEDNNKVSSTDTSSTQNTDTWMPWIQSYRSSHSIFLKVFQKQILSFLMVCRVATFLLCRKVLAHVKALKVNKRILYLTWQQTGSQCNLFLQNWRDMIML